MEAESGKYLEERFPSADKRASGVIRTSARRCIVHVITLISSAHACPERCFVRASRMLQGLASFASKLT